MKNVVITGVSTGIGYDAVRYLTSRGYRVFGSVRRPEDAARLRQEFPRDLFIPLLFDVTDEAAIERARAKVESVLAGESLQALVNNAGYVLGGPIELLSNEAFRQQMEVNLFGVRNVTNTFLPLLGARPGFNGTPGKLINISSISGIFNTPMSGAYCVSKHALESLSEVYRRELMMYGIQVSSIQPGPIQSDLWDKNLHVLDKYLDTEYGRMARNASRLIRRAQRRAKPAETISRLIEKIIVSRKPRLSYVVTPDKILNMILVRLVPRRMADRLLFRFLTR